LSHGAATTRPPSQWEPGPGEEEWRRPDLKVGRWLADASFIPMSDRNGLRYGYLYRKGKEYGKKRTFPYQKKEHGKR
jgi:hypothetical protein